VAVLSPGAANKGVARRTAPRRVAAAIERLDEIIIGYP
jgi:hypothetical protein